MLSRLRSVRWGAWARMASRKAIRHMAREWIKVPSKSQKIVPLPAIFPALDQRVGPSKYQQGPR